LSTDVSEVRAASIIALMMEAERTSETSVYMKLRMRQYIPEDSEILIRHNWWRKWDKTDSTLLSIMEQLRELKSDMNGGQEEE
jgi:hypothetical protein